MPDISALFLTRNEEKNIARCLKSLSFCREIVLIDSGSEDRTLEIAREYTDRIFQHPMDEGFGAQRNFGIGQAKCDWIFWLDADEEVSVELADAIKSIPDSPEYAGYLINRRTKYLGKWIYHSGWYPQYLLRLFNRKFGSCSESKVHERIELSGKAGKLKGDILHYPYGSLFRHIEKLNRYTSIAAIERSEEGRKFSPFKALVSPPGEFCKKYFLRGGFLDGIPGFAIAVTSAYYKFLREMKMYEIEKRD